MKTICNGETTIIKIENSICHLSITDFNYDDIWQKKVDGQFMLHTKAVIDNEGTLTVSGTVVEFEYPKEIRFDSETIYSHFIIEK